MTAVVRAVRVIEQWFKCKQCRVAMEFYNNRKQSLVCPKCKQICTIPAPPKQVVLV